MGLPEPQPRDFVGRGFSFPIDVSGGTVRWSVPLLHATDEHRRAAVTSRIRHIVLTSIYERPIVREFGTVIPESLFSVTQRGAIAVALQNAVTALERWLPTVAVVHSSWGVQDSTVTFALEWAAADGSMAGNSIVEFDTSIFMRARG